jgi:hypothetical protein
MIMRTRTVYLSTTLLLAACLAWASPVAAGKGPPIQVYQAIPNEAEQGQLGLAVKIKGENFGPGSKVRYFVTGTDDDTQIDVQSVAYDEATGDLDIVIDVSETALLSGYDIEVLRGGRGGKGTDLFLVKESTNAPTPVDITARWLPSFVSEDYWMTAAGEYAARACTPTFSYQNHGGSYHCPHQIWEHPIDFDFSGVARIQTRKNGESGLCVAMDGITLVADANYEWYFDGGFCKDADGCNVYTEQWFIGDDVRQAVAEATGLTRPAVDFVRLKASTRVYLGPDADANPYANDLDIVMDTATVRFIKAGTNRDAAVCVYDWSQPGTGDPLVLESRTIP